MLEFIKESYRKTKKRLLFLDYDGTLVPFTKIPSQATIKDETIRILEKLSADSKNTIVIISGREMQFLEKQFVGLNIDLIAEHGASVKEPGKPVERIKLVNLAWKNSFRNLFQTFTTEIPGSFTEEKQTSIAFHYRAAGETMDAKTLLDMKRRVEEAIDEEPVLEMLDGNKVIEVKMAFYNKGITAKKFSERASFDFIMAAGDDITDEDLFRELDNRAFTIKVGFGETLARYRIEEYHGFISFLSELTK